MNEPRYKPPEVLKQALSNRANGAVGLFGSYGIFGEVAFGEWEALADA